LVNSKNTRRLVSVALIILLCVIFGLTTDSFLSVRNLIQLFRQAAFTGLVACGVCFVMVGGGIDLSAGGLICLTGVAVARFSQIWWMPGIAVVLAGIMVGAACGLFNGAVVTRLHMTEFVTTLASGAVFTGLSLLTTFRENGRVVSVTLTNQSFLGFGRTLGGIYWIIIVWVILTVVMQFVMSSTRFGLHVMAMGSQSKSAEMSGVSTRRTKILTFMISGAFAGLAAAMLVAYQTGTNQTLGNMMEFNAIASCVVGGVVLGGGKGDPASGFLGATLMTLITNGLYKLGLTTGGTYVMQGIVILLAMNFDGQFNRISQKRLESRGRL
jgi:ribose/xylose/arabinose/galactoside ABC-type transport system permease subunit